MSELALQWEDRALQTHAARLGFWIFIASELMLFAGLFGLYAALRAGDPEGFRVATRHAALVLGSLNTAILLTSSLTVALAVHAVREGAPRRAATLLNVSAGFGLLFLCFKGAEYAAHVRDGIVPGAHGLGGELATRGASGFFGLYYATTGLHALHVAGGAAILAWLARRARRGDFGRAEHEHVALELGGLYWHFVDVIWLFLWPLFYLLK